jgi:hypothetical protein
MCKNELAHPMVVEKMARRQGDQIVSNFQTLVNGLKMTQASNTFGLLIRWKNMLVQSA